MFANVARRCCSQRETSLVWRGGPQIRRRHLHTPPKSILIVNKLRTPAVVAAIAQFLRHIRQFYPQVEVYAAAAPSPLPLISSSSDLESAPGTVPSSPFTASSADPAPHSAFDGRGAPDKDGIPRGLAPPIAWVPSPSAPKIDLIVTLGGDGTILHASSLFSNGEVPPVLSFSMGTLGFLLPFHVDHFPLALSAVFKGTATVLHRMRLALAFYGAKGERLGEGSDWQVMNELALHRGPSSHLNTIDVFVDGQHLTEAVSDGLILSTPTGSTAYSLSAGGPIVHPSLSALVLTPICPRSLSFRPLVFPRSARVTLKVSPRSRAPATVSMDGRHARQLAPGERVDVEASPFPVPCVNRSSVETGPTFNSPFEDSAIDAAEAFYAEGEGDGQRPRLEDDWVRDINNLLQYNATFKSKALLKHGHMNSFGEGHGR